MELLGRRSRSGCRRRVAISRVGLSRLSAASETLQHLWPNDRTDRLYDSPRTSPEPVESQDWPCSTSHHCHLRAGSADRLESGLAFTAGFYGRSYFTYTNLELRVDPLFNSHFLQTKRMDVQTAVAKSSPAPFQERELLVRCDDANR